MAATCLTRFAPAERLTTEAITIQREFITKSPQIVELLDYVPSMLMILNRQRQILHINKVALNFAGVDEIIKAIGARPGEALGCIHAKVMDAGCGTSEFCRHCGAVRAILASQRGEFSIEECRITIDRNGVHESLDLRVWATPFKLGGEQLTFFSVLDIEHEKRRHALESIFFHDILNTAGALKGLTSFLSDADEKLRMELHERISNLSWQIVDQIQAQKVLIYAENNELEAQIQDVEISSFISSVARGFDSPESLNNRKLVVHPMDSFLIKTDYTLLGRAVTNMVKNALEAALPGEAVSVSALIKEGEARIYVHNPTYMPEKIQRQLFQRSFSTKGFGRGLGTYSMKLLVERYLGGKVWFISDEEQGTTFVVSLPLDE